MSSSTDLMGLGMAFPLATAVGLSNIAITAAGTTTTDAKVCDVQNDFFQMTATGSDGIRLSSSVALLTPIFVTNISGSTGTVYPPTSGTFNGLSANTGIAVGANKSAFFIRYSSTGWLSNLSA